MKLYEPFEFLTASECDKIIAHAKANVIETGLTLRPGKVRNNRVSWYKKSERWQSWIDLFNKIDPVIDWIQTPQVAFYKPGEEYQWHTDTWPEYRTHIRHFTLTCELQSAPGACFEMSEHAIPPLRRGQAVIFRSPERHRATSPTEGERISFTIWAMTKNKNKQPLPGRTS